MNHIFSSLKILVVIVNFVFFGLLMQDVWSKYMSQMTNIAARYILFNDIYYSASHLI
jgi:hypothetical protein